MAEETVIYENKDVKITNLRAIFAEKTYSVANITSVESQTTPPNITLAIILLALIYLTDPVFYAKIIA